MCATCSPSRNRKGKKPVAKATHSSKHGVVASVTAELRGAGMLDSHQGQAALLLAKRLQSGEDTGAAMAQLVRQLGQTMASAMAAAQPDEADPVDELRAKRERRGA